MSNEKEAKLKALKLTLDKLDKAYGKGTVMKMGDREIVDIPSVSTGSLGLDIALGIGLPLGFYLYLTLCSPFTVYLYSILQIS